MMMERQDDLKAIYGNVTCEKHVESMFLYHASSVLCGAKPATLVNVKASCVNLWRNHERALCKASGLSITEMKSREASSLFLIYDAHALYQALQNEKAVVILAELGYVVDGNLDAFIKRLVSRFLGSDFPHEVGLFLGYPPGDVSAYIENEGRNSTCCKYWKVYENVDVALKIWKKIDHAKALALEVLQDFPPIHVAAKQLRAAV